MVPLSARPPASEVAESNKLPKIFINILVYEYLHEICQNEINLLLRLRVLEVFACGQRDS
jgi:hypothetical protein